MTLWRYASGWQLPPGPSWWAPGSIGAEVAASLRELGRPVALLDVAPLPLAHVLGQEIRSVYADLHRERGVDLRVGTGVARFDGADGVEEVVTTDGARLPAELVIVGVGVTPRTKLAEEAGLAADDGILVNDYGETAVDSVFAAGDAAIRVDARSGKRVRHEHWLTAQRQARCHRGNDAWGTRAVQRGSLVLVGPVRLQPADSGQPLPGVELLIRGDMESMCFSAFYLQDGRIAGVVGVNRPRDVRAAMNLIARRLHVEPADLADIEVDLRHMSRREAARTSSSSRPTPG